MQPVLEHVELEDVVTDHHHFAVHHRARRQGLEGRDQFGEVAQQRLAVAAVETGFVAPGQGPESIPLGLVGIVPLGDADADPRLHGADGGIERPGGHVGRLGPRDAEQGPGVRAPVPCDQREE